MGANFKVGLAAFGGSWVFLFFVSFAARGMYSLFSSDPLLAGLVCGGTIVAYLFGAIVFVLMVIYEPTEEFKAVCKAAREKGQK